MKKVLIFTAAITGLFVAGCVKNQESAGISEGEKTWVKASVATPETKLSVDMGDLNPAWVFNDNIKLETTSNGWQEFTLKNGQGTQIGLFEGTGTPKVGSVAIYPASNAGNGSYTFPTEYEFRPLNYDGNAENGDPISEIPMVGKIRGTDDIKFYHVGGAIALKFSEITPSQHKLTVTLEGAPATGTATIDASDPSAALVPTGSTGQVVTVYINKTTLYTLQDQTILVPVPAGTYSKISIDLQVQTDKVTFESIVSKSRTKSFTITAGGIFSFAPLTTDYTNTGKELRAHFPLGGNLNDESYEGTRMVVSWVNTVDNIAYMDADGSGHEPVSLSSRYYEEQIFDSETQTDVYYQFVRLNQEMLDYGVYILEDYRTNNQYWKLRQSRGYVMNVKVTCADPSSKTNADGTPNINYYRFTMETTDGQPLAFFMKSDMEILYKACKNRTITNGDATVYTSWGTSYNTYDIIESLFGGDYDMQNENQQVIWTKPYFEEVTLPDGSKDYVLTSPTFDNGFFITGTVVSRLKQSTATIDGVPVGEYIHTKFMLLNAEIVD